MPEARRLLLGEAAALLLILALAALLRLHNVADNPGWYTDEGTHLEIAANLAAGEIRYFAVNRSFLLFGRLPAFELLLAGAVNLFGVSMLTLRLLTGLLGVLAVALLYLLARLTQPARGLALLAALLLAIYPQAVLYSRLGFSYNLLAPLLLLAALGLVRYLRGGARGWLALAALALGLGLIGDVFMGAPLALTLLVVLIYRWRDALWSGALMALPFAIYAGLALLTDADAFLFDLRFTLGRLGGLPLAEQLHNVALNYTVIISQDFWALAGLIGLFWLRPAVLRGVALLLLAGSVLVIGRTVALYSLSAYYLIPLLPLVPLGVAALLWYGAPRAGQMVAEALPAYIARFAPLIVAALVLVPLLTTVSLTWANVQTRYATVIDPFLLHPEDVRTVAAYVNARVTPDDVVIASPGVGWHLAGQVADFQMSVAASGEGTVHLPPDLPPDRFAFDPDYEQARFVVVDNLWRNWGAVHMPGVAVMLATVEATWTPVLTQGALVVYTRPA